MNDRSYILNITPAEICKFTMKLRTTWDFVKLVCIVGQYFILHSRELVTAANAKHGYVKISYGKNGGRCFIYIGCNKYISFVFPFIFNGRDLRYEKNIIDETFAAHLISIAEDGQKGASIVDLYNDNGNIDIESKIPEDCLRVMEKLLLVDSGYIRHDDDPGSAKGDIHPRYHFDIYFAKNATFKIGLLRMLSTNGYENFFNRNKPKFFIDRLSRDHAVFKKLLISKNKKTRRH